VPRRTKIIATIGPASDDPAILRAMIEAGMDVARIGLAHGSLAEAIERYRRIRKIADEVGRPVGILADLPGPKVRCGSFGDGAVELVGGSTVELHPGHDEPSAATYIGVDYENLLDDLHVGDMLALGDGAVRLRVVSINGSVAKAEVTDGGIVQGRPGLHVPSDRLRMATPTAEDLYMLDAFVDEGVDMVALSFVRSAHDLRRVGTEPHPRGPLIVAKIETRAAVENLEGIIEAAGAVMVARGDLGIELGIEDLPHIQKRIVRECIAVGRPAITATPGSPTR
jgi:pyruvate kinase